MPIAEILTDMPAGEKLLRARDPIMVRFPANSVRKMRQSRQRCGEYGAWRRQQCAEAQCSADAQCNG
ncbi:hypothetical protein [Sphingomonas sp. 28-62-20]|uniref:hypothetical protein n=1 Tax=Sphingomonas sp. 28-62-20 TaxID=1970433 RepID=UPI0035A8CBBB